MGREKRTGAFPNPQRIRKGSIVDGEGYGVAKVVSVEKREGQIYTRISYGADFSFGAMLNGPTPPERLVYNPEAKGYYRPSSANRHYPPKYK